MRRKILDPYKYIHNLEVALNRKDHLLKECYFQIDNYTVGNPNKLLLRIANEVENPCLNAKGY